MAAWIKMSYGREGGLGPRDIVLDGDPAPLPKKGQSRQIFGPRLLWPNGWRIKMALGMKLGLGPGHIVLDWDPAPLPKKGAEPPQVSAHFYCDQTAGYIKMPLGMEVCLSPGDVVLDGDPSPSPKRGGALIFRPTSIMAKQLHGSRCHLERR